jgi:hypothetical protein
MKRRLIYENVSDFYKLLLKCSEKNIILTKIILVVIN